MCQCMLYEDKKAFVLVKYRKCMKNVCNIIIRDTIHVV